MGFLNIVEAMKISSSQESNCYGPRGENETKSVGPWVWNSCLCVSHILGPFLIDDGPWSFSQVLSILDLEL